MVVEDTMFPTYGIEAAGEPDPIPQLPPERQPVANAACPPMGDRRVLDPPVSREKLP